MLRFGMGEMSDDAGHDGKEAVVRDHRDFLDVPDVVFYE